MFLDSSPVEPCLVDGKSILKYLAFRWKGFVISAREFSGFVGDLGKSELRFGSENFEEISWFQALETCVPSAGAGRACAMKIKRDVLKCTFSCQLCREVQAHSGSGTIWNTLSGQ
ncbi:hypothetical protein SDJN02_12499 [Cucurbita argyrosperma subsp. argyrosperma]|nr:hypothetical protein SDJN02_12499 [Cucurbita argyrosperma subsp. argyrosperma]